MPPAPHFPPARSMTLPSALNFATHVSNADLLRLCALPWLISTRYWEHCWRQGIAALSFAESLQPCGLSRGIMRRSSIHAGLRIAQCGKPISMHLSADHALKVNHRRGRAAGMLQKCWNVLTKTVVRPGLRLKINPTDLLVHSMSHSIADATHSNLLLIRN